ncbi:rho-related GTP-binding protein RhoH isoform X2 [Motacilla alba alba]|uniref:rho-related GTP-binding protein RhoH isoform X2 n=1 Tax=Motacilla alba alba TaxID=1094192 RepID=UPI0018D4EE1A|nr:rho-related GTP-binding protein RhoH isoform X2 [Motacilla alba alba]
MRDAEVTVPGLLQRLPQQCSLPCREEASLLLSQMFPFIAQHEEVERSRKTAVRKIKILPKANPTNNQGSRETAAFSFLPLLYFHFWMGQELHLAEASFNVGFILNKILAEEKGSHSDLSRKKDPACAGKGANTSPGRSWHSGLWLHTVHDAASHTQA